MDEENNIRVPERHFDASSKQFQGKEKGQVIKSLRKFGVEVEMIHTKRKSIADLAKGVAEAFGFEHDGSIDAGGGIGIEVVSPIMKGRIGELGIRDLFVRINKLGFLVNKTCGLHVHLDGKDFSKNEKYTIVHVESVDETLLANLAEDDYAFVIKKEVMEALGKNSSMNVEDIARLVMDEYLTCDNNTLFLSKSMGHSVPDIQVKDSVMVVGKSKTLIDMYALGEATPEYASLSGVEVKANVPSPDDLFCVMYSNRNLQNVLTLLYLHTVYGDVFMSMLPKSRRQENLYCQQLSLGFSAGQIETIQTFTELENAWYKTRTINETQRKKGNKYDDSRYFSINLHSLFAKYGTIEFRSHSATLDPNKVLYWVAFHQEILDNIVSGKINIRSLSKGSHLFHVEDKTKFLMEALQLRQPLKTYMQQRIDYFKNNEKN